MTAKLTKKDLELAYSKEHLYRTLNTRQWASLAIILGAPNPWRMEHKVKLLEDLSDMAKERRDATGETEKG